MSSLFVYLKNPDFWDRWVEVEGGKQTPITSLRLVELMLLNEIPQEANVALSKEGSNSV